MTTITDLIDAVVALPYDDKCLLVSAAKGDRPYVRPIFTWLATVAFFDDDDDRDAAAIELVGILDGLGVPGNESDIRPGRALEAQERLSAQSRDELARTVGRLRNNAVAEGKAELAEVWNLLFTACREATELPRRLEQSMVEPAEIIDDDSN